MIRDLAKALLDKWRAHNRAREAETETAWLREERRAWEASFTDAKQQIDGLQEHIRLLEATIVGFDPERRRLRELEVSAPVVNAMRAWWETKREKDWGDVADACKKAWGSSPSKASTRARSPRR